MIQLHHLNSQAPCAPDSCTSGHLSTGCSVRVLHSKTWPHLRIVPVCWTRILCWCGLRLSLGLFLELNYNCQWLFGNVLMLRYPCFHMIYLDGRKRLFNMGLFLLLNHSSRLIQQIYWVWNERILCESELPYFWDWLELLCLLNWWHLHIVLNCWICYFYWRMLDGNFHLNQLHVHNELMLLHIDWDKFKLDF